MTRPWLIVAAVGTTVLIARGARVIDLIANAPIVDRMTALALPVTVVASIVLAFRDARFPTMAGSGGLATLVLCGVVAGAAAFAPVLSPADPNSLHLDTLLAPPSPTHWFGTDLLGRDYLTRVLYGLRTSLLIAVSTMTMAIIIGTVVGTTAALHPRLDGPLMRLVDIGMAFPRVFLLLVLFAFWTRITIPAIIVILGLTGWYHASRMVRGETLVIASQEYLAAAGALGVRGWRRIARHVLPNLAPVITVTVVLGIGNVMLIESGLAYLGIAVPVPSPSLGRMINDGTDQFSNAPWLAMAPGIVIALTVTAFGLLGDRLQHAMDPRSS